MTARLARLYLQLYIYESHGGKIEAQFKFTTEDAGCPLCRLSDTDRMTGNVRLHCTPKGNTHIERRAAVAITQRGKRGVCTYHHGENQVGQVADKTDDPPHTGPFLFLGSSIQLPRKRIGFVRGVIICIICYFTLT